MPHSASKSIFLAPAPRIVSDILDESDLLRLRAIGDLLVHEDGPVTKAIFKEKAVKAEIIIGPEHARILSLRNRTRVT